MSKVNNEVKITKSESESKPRVPRRTSFGYQSAADKALYDKARLAGYYAFAAMFMSICVFALCVVNTFMIKGLTDTDGTIKSVDWVEFTLDNDVGYSVKSNWNTSYYQESLVFQPTETTAISVSSQSIKTINETSNTNLTYDTLKEYIERDLKRIGSEDGYSVDDIKFKKYDVLDTSGYLYTFKQTQPTDNNGSGVAYTASLFFIYKDYLYSFAYASPVQTYTSPDYEHVLSSIRIVPENEDDFTSVAIDFDTKIDTDSSMVSDYANFGSSVASDINSKIGDSQSSSTGTGTTTSLSD